MVSRTGWLASCVVIFSFVPLRAQVSSSINPTADAFVTTGSSTTNRSNNNYGAAGALSISATGKAQGEFQSLLKFNLAGSVSAFNATYGLGKWTVQSVTLQLVAQNPGNPIFNSSSAGSFGGVWQQNDSWVEGTGSPNSPTMDGVSFSSLASLSSPADASIGVFSFSGATSGAFVYTLLLPPGFTSDIMAGGDVSLRLFAADANVSAVFNSENFGTPANRPLLDITAVPETNTLALFGTGIAFLLMRRVRQASRCH